MATILNHHKATTTLSTTSQASTTVPPSGQCSQATIDWCVDESCWCEVEDGQVFLFDFSSKKTLYYFLRISVIAALKELGQTPMGTVWISTSAPQALITVQPPRLVLIPTEASNVLETLQLLQLG